MIETVATIKTIDDWVDSFEIIHDTDDNTVSFFVLGSDEGVTFEAKDIPTVIKALQRIEASNGN